MASQESQQPCLKPRQQITKWISATFSFPNQYNAPNGVTWLNEEKVRLAKVGISAEIFSNKENELSLFNLSDKIQVEGGDISES